MSSTIERSERRRRLARSALSARIRTAPVEAVTPPTEICAATLESTIVVLRDGRRCRSWHADVAQLVAHHLAKVRVAGSNPVIRSRVQSHQPQRWSGRVVRQRPAKPCTRVRFPSPPPSSTPARLAQRESASLTRKRSLVQSQYRAPVYMQFKGGFSAGQRASCQIRAKRGRPLGVSRFRGRLALYRSRATLRALGGPNTTGHSTAGWYPDPTLVREARRAALLGRPGMA